MTMLFGFCALVGTTVLICQFVLTLAGLGDDGLGHDASDHAGGDHFQQADHHGGSLQDDHHHHGTEWFFKMITFRTVVAALAFFGLAGLASDAAEFTTPQTLAIAVAAGFAAMVAVHWAMQQMIHLQADGTVHTEQAVGRSGTVYIPVRGQNRGAGKIQLNLQNRTMEFQAVTEGDDLPTGTHVVVLRVLGPDTVEVVRAPAPEVSHA